MLTVLILLISGEFLETVESSCTLNNKQYSEGDKWHPVLEPFGSRCVECVCKQGEVECVNTVKCPPVTCVNPKTDPRMCCPVCEDFDNIPPTVDIDSSKNGGDQGKECVYEEKKYSHGEIFPSNSTGLVPTSPSQCVNCACTNGQVFCHLKTCDVPKGCSQIIKDKNDCCPKCADCKVAGEVHRNNTEWNPAFGRDRMPCVTCKCFNGIVTCQKKECPTLSCKRKRKPRKGQCCETCRKPKKDRKQKNNKKNKKKEENRKCNNIEKKKGKRKNKSGKKRRDNRGYCLQQEATDTVYSVNSSLPSLFPKTNNSTQHCLFKKLCLPKKAKYLVYRLIEDNSHAFFAFDDLKSNTVDVWRFNITNLTDAKAEFKDKVSGFQELQYPAGWFRQQISDEKIILGAARNKKLSTFKRRLRRSYDRCSTNSDKICTSKIFAQELLCSDFDEINRKCGERKTNERRKKSKSKP